MEISGSKTQMTYLLDNDVLNRIERMRINPLCRNTSRHRGEQLAGRGGSNTEFSDYRDYVYGDDTRFIDWNIFSRLHRPYLKIFRLEEEMHVLIILDGSSSMNFGGKIELAKQISASFAVMALFGGQKTSIYYVSENRSGLPKCLHNCRGCPAIKKVFSFIEKTVTCGSLPFDKAVDNVLKFHKGKGVAILVTDFLTFGDIKRSFNLLFSAGLEIYALQILSPAELEPEITGDIRLLDSENSATLDISSAGDLLHFYHEHKNAFISEIEKNVRQRSGRYVLVPSDTNIKTVLFEILLRKGWIK